MSLLEVIGIVTIVVLSILGIITLFNEMFD